MRKVLTAAAAACLIPAVAQVVAAAPAGAEPCGVTVKSFGVYHSGIGYGYQVTFYRTCGLYLRAYYHDNNFPYGTSYDYGNTITPSSTTTTSSTLIATTNNCSMGYQVKSTSTGSWSSVNLGGYSAC